MKEHPSYRTVIEAMRTAEQSTFDAKHLTKRLHELLQSTTMYAQPPVLTQQKNEQEHREKESN